MGSAQHNQVANFILGIADDVLPTFPTRTSQQQLRADLETHLEGFSADAHDDADTVRKEARA